MNRRKPKRQPTSRLGAWSGRVRKRRPWSRQLSRHGSSWQRRGSWPAVMRGRSRRQRLAGFRGPCDNAPLTPELPPGILGQSYGRTSHQPPDRVAAPARDRAGTAGREGLGPGPRSDSLCAGAGGSCRPGRRRVPGQASGSREWGFPDWRDADNQCPVEAGRRGRVRGAVPTRPRQALIDRVRREIASDTYETQAKLDALLRRLAHDLQLAKHPAIEGGGGRREREEDPAHRRNALGGGYAR